MYALATACQIVPCALCGAEREMSVIQQVRVLIYKKKAV